MTAFAILSILLGIMGQLGALSSLLMFQFGDWINLGINPVHDLVNASFAYRVFYLATLGLGIIFATILLIAGIGLLKMSTLARKLAISYAVYSILVNIGANVVHIFALYAPMWEQIGQQAEEQQIVTIVITCVAVASAIFALIFPIAILIYFLRSSVKQAFLNWQETATVGSS